MRLSSSRTPEMKRGAKALLSKPAGPLLPFDFSGNPNAPTWMTRCFRNNRYTVMINDNAIEPRGMPASLAMIQRHDDAPIPNHWRELQKIKNAIYGDEAWGCEYYPPMSELKNIANVYWLWVPKETKNEI